MNSAIYGLSPDIRSIREIRRYHDRGGRRTPPSMDYPRMSWVSMASADTLTEGVGELCHLQTIYGLSTDVQSICGFRA